MAIWVTTVLHRHFHGVREAPDFKGLLRCRISLAEREGFEPPIGLHLCRISSAVHSTTLPPLQAPFRVIHSPLVGPSYRRGRRGRQGAGATKITPPSGIKARFCQSSPGGP